MPGKVIIVEIQADGGQSKQVMSAFTTEKDIKLFLDTLSRDGDAKMIVSDNTLLAVQILDSPQP